MVLEAIKTVTLDSVESLLLKVSQCLRFNTMIKQLLLGSMKKQSRLKSINRKIWKILDYGSQDLNSESKKFNKYLITFIHNQELLMESNMISKEFLLQDMGLEDVLL